MDSRSSSSFVVADGIKDLLREMKTATDQGLVAGAPRLSQTEQQRFMARYEKLLATGLAANPPPYWYLAVPSRPGALLAA